MFRQAKTRTNSFVDSTNKFFGKTKNLLGQQKNVVSSISTIWLANTTILFPPCGNNSKFLKIRIWQTIRKRNLI